MFGKRHKSEYGYKSLEEMGVHVNEIDTPSQRNEDSTEDEYRSCTSDYDITNCARELRPSISFKGILIDIATGAMLYFIMSGKLAVLLGYILEGLEYIWTWPLAQ